MFWTLIALGLVGLLVGTLFKVQVLIIASLAAATIIFGGAIAEGMSLLKAGVYALVGLGFLQAFYMVGVVVGTRVLVRSRIARLPQETTN